MLTWAQIADILELYYLDYIADQAGGPVDREHLRSWACRYMAKKGQSYMHHIMYDVAAFKEAMREMVEAYIAEARDVRSAVGGDGR